MGVLEYILDMIPGYTATFAQPQPANRQKLWVMLLRRQVITEETFLSVCPSDIHSEVLKETKLQQCKRAM